jgi:DNA-binding MarR family transcriptional regulator
MFFIVNEIHDMRSALDRVLALAVVLNDDMERDLARRGLTRSRAHLVWVLRKRGGPSTQQALAEALGVTPRAITSLVDALADGGFVTRESHPSDRRATLVTFTQRGKQAAKALDHDHEELARKLFGDMAPAAFRGFTRGLDEVLDGLRAVAEANASRVPDPEPQIGDP